MKILRLLALVAILATWLTGCRKESPTTVDPRQQIITNWSDAFQGFWDGMNYNYVFWSVDPTNWDDVYAQYKPKFVGLKTGDPTDDAKAIELFKELSSTLIDHHMNISIKTENMADEVSFAPSANEITNRTYYHDMYDKELLYRVAQQNQASGRISNLVFEQQRPEPESERRLDMLSYLIDGDIAYLTFNEFYITSTINYEPQGPIARAYNNFIEIINNTPSLKGVVIDVRQNGGGSTADFDYVVTPFLKTRTVFGYTRSKNGLGRLDYAPWAPMELDPKQNVFNRSLDVPVVVLVDLNSVSMSEMSALALKQMPNGKVIGERTWGGHGPLNSYFDVNYTGSFEVGSNKIISVYTSTWMGVDSEKNCYEGIGVKPNIEVLLDLDAMENGVDNQLERAISFIHKGQ